ncbi:MAG: hypothetical protein RR614_15515 [Eubacterium sp.]
MDENVYGIGRPVIRQKRSYCVEARCRVSKSIAAGDPKEAQQLFDEAAEAVEDVMPEVVFEIEATYEEEAPW